MTIAAPCCAELVMLEEVLIAFPRPACTCLNLAGKLLACISTEPPTISGAELCRPAIVCLNGFDWTSSMAAGICSASCPGHVTLHQDQGAGTAPQ